MQFHIYRAGYKMQPTLETNKLVDFKLHGLLFWVHSLQFLLVVHPSSILVRQARALEKLTGKPTPAYGKLFQEW